MAVNLSSVDSAGTPGAEVRVALSCPACHARELVQAYLPTRLHLAWRKGARCLVCGHRFRVSDVEFAKLRRPTWGEPNETFTDRYTYMLASPMRGSHLAICLAALLLGLSLGGVLAARFDEPLFIAVFFPVVCLGWWFGRWLRPPVERIGGKCPQCRYDLRGLTRGVCPECGTPFEPSSAAAEGPASEGRQARNSTASAGAR
jgi:hypothetical protein